jgi:hypothetical protein
MGDLYFGSKPATQRKQEIPLMPNFLAEILKKEI